MPNAETKPAETSSPDPRDTDAADVCCTGSTTDQTPCCGDSLEAPR
jgi:hypothetical protein